MMILENGSLGKMIIALLLVFAALILLPGSLSGADAVFSVDEAEATEPHQILENLPLYVDDREAANIKTLHYTYRNNRFVSLRDFAAALRGTPKHFRVSFDEDQVCIVTGEDYTPAEGEGSAFAEELIDPLKGSSFTTYPLALNPIMLNGHPLHYRSFIGFYPEEQPDCFISLTDLAMQLDLSVALEDGKLFLNTEEGFAVDPDTIRKEEFYYEIHSALVGDAATGEVLVSKNAEASVPIASTSKLMTYLILMDLVREGAISLDDTVVIPESAAIMSESDDGEIPMTPGEEASVSDLLTGMLVPSSDECALALAVYAAGSEEEFVSRMKQKAEELHLSDATVFFNSHGLPLYSDDIPASKIQNRMSAQDMFILVQHILKQYPQVLEITSQKSAFLESFQMTVENTNPLLYNVPGVAGLKTGTTDMAGDCLVVVMEVTDPGGQMHYLTVIQFGAEDETIRATLTEELIRYGQQVYSE